MINVRHLLIGVEPFTYYRESGNRKQFRPKANYPFPNGYIQLPREVFSALVPPTVLIMAAFGRRTDGTTTLVKLALGSAKHTLNTRTSTMNVIREAICP